ncbi:MAG: hypothetical protein ACYCZR_05640 [Burkholderiales bacterium]
MMLFMLASLLLSVKADFARDSGPQPKTQNGITYFSGGIGTDECVEMNSRRHGYNLIMTCADESGAYLADVQVLVKSLDGEERLDAVPDGPFFFRGNTG